MSALPVMRVLKADVFLLTKASLAMTALSTGAVEKEGVLATLSLKIMWASGSAAVTGFMAMLSGSRVEQLSVTSGSQCTRQTAARSLVASWDAAVRRTLQTALVRDTVAITSTAM